MGWSLNVGGVITRSVKGNPDLVSNYYGKSADIVLFDGTVVNDKIAEQDFLKDVNKGKIEAQPDIYFFNIGGISGKFSIKSNGQVYMSEKRDVVISPTLTAPFDVPSFIIKDNNGTEYEFTATETTNMTLSDDIPLTRYTYDYISSWYLTKITSPITNESIVLTYNASSVSYEQPVNQYSNSSVHYITSTIVGQNSTFNTVQDDRGVESVFIGRKYLSNISYFIGAQKIEEAIFTTSNTTGEQLNSIEIKGYDETAQSSVIKAFTFTYNNTNRRKLTEFKESPTLTSTTDIKKHTFEYDPNNLPPITSYQIDHWGYYNNNGASSLVPPYVNGSTTYAGGGANREADETNMKASVMTKITYPTGGYTQFNFEGHRVNSVNNNYRLIGGLRVKEIGDYDYNGQLLTKKSYKYLDASGISSGILFTEPQYNSSSSNSNCGGPSGLGGQQDPASSTETLTLSANSVGELGSSVGSHIGYSRVEEYTVSTADPLVNTGKTVYFYENTVINAGDIENIKNGDLVKVEAYDTQNRIVSKKENQYDYTKNSRLLRGIQALPEANQTSKLILTPSGTWIAPKGKSCCEKGCSPDLANCCEYPAGIKTYQLRMRRYYKYYREQFKYMMATTGTQYFYDANNQQTSIVTSTAYDYNATFQHLSPISTKVTNSDGNTHTTLSYYPHECTASGVYSNTAMAQTLVTKNMIASPLKVELYFSTQPTQLGTRTKGYQVLFGTDLRPTEFQLIYKNGTIETVETINSYNASGLPLSTTAKGFTAVPKTYIWDIQNRLKEQNWSTLKWQYEYYPKTTLLKSTINENSVKAHFEYDGLQRLKTTRSFLSNNADPNSANARTEYSYQYANGSNSGNLVQTKSWFADYSNPYLGIYTQQSSQYFDGLGRPLESVKEGYTPSGQHLKSFMTYDNFGRQDRSYQPFESATNTFEPIAAGVPRASRPYVNPVYEQSPLSRPLKQINEDLSETNMAYSVNTVVDAVKLFTPGTTTTLLANNVAIGKPVTLVNYDYASASSGGNFLEMIPNSEWRFDPTTPQSSITYDLGQLVGIQQLNLKILQTTAASSTHQIWGSFDNISWTMLEGNITATNNQTIVRNYVGGSQLVIARYIRIVSDAGAGNRACWSKVEIMSTTNGFAAAQLSKTTVTDENTNQTVVFKDKLGRVVLTRKIAESNQFIDTYNVYDDYGNLVLVISPDAFDDNLNIKENLVFRYTYDNQHRLSQKKIPGADWQKFYYDNRDLLVLTQDGNMRTPQYGGAADKHLATRYDDLGRVVETGWMYITPPTTGNVTTAITITAANSLSQITYIANRSLVSQTKSRVLGYKKATDADWIHTYTFNYDQWSRAVRTESNTLTGSYHMNYSDINFAGLPRFTAHQWTGPDFQNRSTFQYNYYDHSLRPTNTVHKIALDNSWTNNTQDRLVSSLKYNFRDQLIEKNIGGVYNAGTSSYKYTQSLDFQYNIRNWLTNINSGDLSSPTGKEYPLFSCANYNSFYNYTGQYSTPPLNGEDNPDLFTQVLRYDNPTIAIGNVPQQRNGNISQIEWQVAGREKQAYSFKYDKLNRLTEANYTDIHTGAWSNNGWAAQYEQNDKYKEALTYDQRGNIKTLLRSGSLFNSTSPNGLLCSFNGTIDNLQYTYNDKNQVTAINDAADLTKGFKTIANGGAYSYDANGNMIADPNKGISNIEYNYLNLPMRITFTGNRKIDFIYDAGGKKWRKVVNDNGVETYRDYIDGAEYQNGQQDIIHFTEGYVQRDATTDGDANWKGWVYKYTLKDHLGNTRVTYSDRDNNGVVGVSDIEQVNHYYGSGLNMEGSWNGAAGQLKYQYTGKEWNDDFGLGWNDYGARFYDPAVFRWLSVDPLAEIYYSYSPYNYTMNNPIRFIDPNGMSVDDYIGSAGALGGKKKKSASELGKEFDNSQMEDIKNSRNNIKDLSSMDIIGSSDGDDEQQQPDPDQAEKDVADSHGDVSLHYAKSNGSLPSDLKELETEIGSFLQSVNRNGGLGNNCTDCVINIELANQITMTKVETQQDVKNLKDQYKSYVYNGVQGRGDKLAMFLYKEISKATASPSGGKSYSLALPNITAAVNNYYTVKNILNKLGVQDRYIRIRWTHGGQSVVKEGNSISYSKPKA